MKIETVWSSPNEHGLTAAAKDAVILGARQGGAEVGELWLNRFRLEHCRACGSGWGTCRTEGRCVLQDDFEEIYARLRAADGIVFVTAVYWHDQTECMKAFLDRLRRCETAHNGALEGRRCLLADCAGGTGNGATECLVKLEEYLRHMGMRAYDRVPVVRFSRGYMLPALTGAGKAYAAALRDGFDMQY